MIKFWNSSFNPANIDKYLLTTAHIIKSIVVYKVIVKEILFFWKLM